MTDNNVINDQDIADTIDDFDRQMVEAKQLGGDLGMTRYLSAMRRKDEFQRAVEAEVYANSPEGQAAAAASELRALAVAMPPSAWRRLYETQGLPVPPQPSDFDLSLRERSRASEIRMTALAAEEARKRGR